MRTRFLIVDDSELVRQSLRTVLQANPEWEIVGEASNGQEALELFQTSRANLVILDFQMPGMNGIETAQRILKIAPAMPIILFTQHAGPELEAHALGVGIRSVVSKTDTFPMVKIIEALLDVLKFPRLSSKKRHSSTNDDEYTIAHWAPLHALPFRIFSAWYLRPISSGLRRRFCNRVRVQRDRGGLC